MKTITIKCNDGDNRLENLLNYIKKNGNTGHSFNIVVDPDSDNEESFGWDGDGSDYIEEIKTTKDMKKSSVGFPLNDTINKMMNTKVKKLVILSKAELNYKIYCDMDGVLSDFEPYYIKTFGSKPVFEGDKTFKEIRKVPHWWKNMTMTKDGKQLWNHLKGLRLPLSILTSNAPVKGYKEDKLAWVSKNLGSGAKMIISTKKEKYVEGKNTILIDDLDRNIDAWKEAGGTAIKHTSTKNSIDRLNKIINKDKQ